MKIFKNCWDKIDTYNCQYGAHVFFDSTAEIYVNQWLAPSRELYHEFSRVNDEGYAGHCKLVFTGVRKFDFQVTLIHKGEGGKLFWRDPMCTSYEGNVTEDLKEYILEGSLHGFSSSVSINVEAQGFELHILENDEPARQS